MHRWRLVGRALWELLRYDVVVNARGFRSIHGSLRRMRPALLVCGSDLEDRIREAMKWALSLYWKPALCLQQSVAMARLLRRHGVDAQVVIGCRSEPFFSHAWVEVEGRVVNDSRVYQQRLFVLERM